MQWAANVGQVDIYKQVNTCTAKPWQRNTNCQIITKKSILWYCEIPKKVHSQNEVSSISKKELNSIGKFAKAVFTIRPKVQLITKKHRVKRNYPNIQLTNQNILYIKLVTRLLSTFTRLKGVT